METKETKKREFYAVLTTITDTKSTVTLLGKVMAETKPDNEFKFTNRADYYKDYFSTKEEAERFIEVNDIR